MGYLNVQVGSNREGDEQVHVYLGYGGRIEGVRTTRQQAKEQNEYIQFLFEKREGYEITRYSY